MSYMADFQRYSQSPILRALFQHEGGKTILLRRHVRVLTAEERRAKQQLRKSRCAAHVLSMAFAVLKEFLREQKIQPEVDTSNDCKNYEVSKKSNVYLRQQLFDSSTRIGENYRNKADVEVFVQQEESRHLFMNIVYGGLLKEYEYLKLAFSKSIIELDKYHTVHSNLKTMFERVRRRAELLEALNVDLTQKNEQLTQQLRKYEDKFKQYQEDLVDAEVFIKSVKDILANILEPLQKRVVLEDGYCNTGDDKRGDGITLHIYELKTLSALLEDLERVVSKYESPR